MDTDQHEQVTRTIDMLRRCDDDVAAYILAFNAVDPAELRACSYPLGVAHIDSLRDLTLAVTAAARDLDQTAAAVLTAWVAVYRGRDRDAAKTIVSTYLAEKGRTRDDH